MKTATKKKAAVRLTVAKKQKCKKPDEKMLKKVRAYLEKTCKGNFVVATQSNGITSVCFGTKTKDIDGCYMIDSLSEQRRFRNSYL